jgi:hypothetical protein
MATFIDESGDAGPSERSPRFFRLAAVWFENADHVQHYLDAILDLRAKNSFPEKFEFHFTNLNDRNRSLFFETVLPLSFKFTMCSIDKRSLSCHSLSKDIICRTAVQGLVDQLTPWYLHAEEAKEGTAGLNENIVYDECNDNKYVKNLEQKFKSLISGRGHDKRLVRSVKPGKSKADPRLQLADMICGATCWHLDGDSRYYELFSRKEITGRSPIEKKRGVSERSDTPL